MATAKEGKWSDTEGTKARILTICGEIEKALDLGWIDVRHVFSPDEPDDDATAAITQARWQYRCARITWNLDFAHAMSDEALWDCAVHEYVHVLMGPIDAFLQGDKMAEKVEFTTESIAIVLRRLLKGEHNG